jgi:hypothetical protein
MDPKVEQDIKKLFELKRLWRRACGYDHIPEGSRFVAFSDQNPYIQDYNKLARKVLAR